MHNATRAPDFWRLDDIYYNFSDYNNLDGIHYDSNTANSLEFDPSLSSSFRTDLMFGDGFNLSWAVVSTLNVQFQSQFTSLKVINTSDHLNYSGPLDYTPLTGST
jgi:hypothetical protein